ncbi:MAG: hypothetical protein HQL03_15270 [Nitrospirae bacterium]|nr:hypothetical protein [Nitrospirota bacterium]
MTVTLPLELYEALEKSLGREGAKQVINAVETAISNVTEYKWATSKDALLSEMKKEFATKADLALLKADLALQEARINSRIDKLESKMLLYFLILIFVIILTNSRALDLLYKFSDKAGILNCLLILSDIYL